MAYIIDIILLVIFAVVIIASVKKGFFRSLFDLIGSILAFILARIFASSAAPAIFSSIVAPGAQRHLASSLSDIGTTDYVTQVEQAISSIPEGLSGIMEIIGFEKQELVDKVSSLNLNGNNLVESIMNTVVEPVGTAVIQFMLVAVLAFVLIFVIKFVVKVLDKIITKLPVIGKFNSVLGGVFGAVRGIIVVGIFAMLISVIAGFISNEEFITLVDNSIIVSTFEGLLNSLSGINV